MRMENCEYGHGQCTAPDTKCIHWMGTFCELDIDEAAERVRKYAKEHPEVINKLVQEMTKNFVDVKDIAVGDQSKFTIKADCNKCVYEVGCHGDPVDCKSYKRDAPDGGYYG